jgi:Outer membrane protein beta-barrel domain
MRLICPPLFSMLCALSLLLTPGIMRSQMSLSDLEVVLQDFDEGESATTTQSKQLPKASLVNGDNDWILRSELLVGASFNHAYGSYIKYQKSFHDIYYPDAEVTGNIKPTYAISAGALFRLKPFKGALQPLSVALGVSYAQKGFTNKYRYVYTAPDPNQPYTDEMVFKESMKLHYLAIPISLRWELLDRIFVDLGLSRQYALSGTRKHEVNRKVTGEGAYNGGFDISEKSDFNYEPGEVLKKAVNGLFVGAGVNITSDWQLMLTLNHTRSVLSDDTNGNFNNLSLHFHVVAPLFKI